jgi:2-succinyl-6-hydroxy-2,4-cyclohexadiene-1-carboxylate synthase
MNDYERAPAVVFVPGFMQHGAAWAPVAELLPERYPSVALEHRAHDYDGRLEEIAAAAPRGAALVGYSLGGRLALRAALHAPDRYGAVILVGATAGIEDVADAAVRREADEQLAAWIERQPIEAVVERWERQPVFSTQSKQLVAGQRPGRLSHEPRELASLLRSAGQGTLAPVWDRLPGLHTPVLALAGALDPRYAETAERIAQACPQGHAALIEGAGHAAQLERPDEVARLSVEFLDQHLVQHGG